MTNTRQPILGVDFDDTLFLNSFPHNYDEPNWPVIDFVKQKQKDGWYIILVTCRTSDEHINGAIQAAERVGLHFDLVNQNHQGMIDAFGDCRKIFCDLYIDDKNMTLGQILNLAADTSAAERSGHGVKENTKAG